MIYRNFIFVFCWLSGGVAVAAPSEQQIADFIGGTRDQIHIECPQKSYDIKSDGEGGFLNICLNYKDAQKRCEISISGFDNIPAQYDVSFELKEAKNSPSERWHTVMQIHSFPDKTEKWRCPPLSVEVKNGKFRAYSRWDIHKVSRTYGNNCTEAGSSIQ